jgi:hypothetical protein
MMRHTSGEHRHVLDLARQAYLGEVKDEWMMRRADVEAFAGYCRGVLARLIR